MQIWHTETEYTDAPSIYDDIFTEKTAFFDIETTGFSPKHAICYLIGVVTRHGDRLHIDQFFSEHLIDEEDVLKAFASFLQPYDRLITFNGTGFDLPFLNVRCQMLSIPLDFSSFEHIDLFKLVSEFRNILKLPNYKQKTLEEFLGVSRDDKFSGGELINTYFEYQKTNSSEQLHLLKLHNYEDILGMVSLLSLFSYHYLFDGRFHVASLEKNDFQEFEGDTRQEMIVTLKAEIPFPKRISYGFDDIYFSAFQNTARFVIRIYNGELKYFYKNYKDYYYLPTEDYAIHKSVAFYVDKDYRTRAKAATCYSKKTGCFLPQYEEIIDPYFKLEYHDKKSFFECTQDFYQSDDAVERYCKHLLSMLIAK